MITFTIDLLLFIILAFCVWQGYRKGVFLSLVSILIIFIAAGAAGRIAVGYAEPLADKLQPLLGWVADDSIDAATRGKGTLAEITDQAVLTEVVRDTYSLAGISGKATQKMTEMTFAGMNAGETSLREAISKTLLFAVSHMFISLFAFVILSILLTLLMHFAASVFRLPTFPLIDKIGGPVCGLLYGVLILGVVGWAIRYVGFLVTPEMVSKTTLLELFTHVSLLSGVLSF